MDLIIFIIIITLIAIISYSCFNLLKKNKNLIEGHTDSNQVNIADNYKYIPNHNICLPEHSHSNENEYSYTYTHSHSGTEVKVAETQESTTSQATTQASTSSQESTTSQATTSGYTALTDSNFKTACQDWCSNSSSAESTYGHIKDWDTSNITSMQDAFNGCTNFNEDISGWNTSSVTSMQSMFYEASSFNQDLSGWDVSNVNTMVYAFWYATSFNQDLNKWDTEKVTNMGGTFDHATSFNGDITSWDTQNTTNMEYMFRGASSFNKDLSGWNVGNVTDMGYMFYGASSFNKDLSGWNVSNVTRMTDMFSGSGTSEPSSWSATTTPAPTTQASTSSQATTQAPTTTPSTESITTTQDSGEAWSVIDTFDSEYETVIRKLLNSVYKNDFDEDDTPITETDFGTFYNTDAGKELIDWFVTSIGELGDNPPDDTISLIQNIAALRYAYINDILDGELSSQDDIAIILAFEYMSDTYSNLIAFLRYVYDGTNNSSLDLEAFKEYGSSDGGKHIILFMFRVLLALNYGSPTSDYSDNVMTETIWTNTYYNNFTAITADNFKTACQAWCSDSSSALKTYGHIRNWDTSAVTNMKEAFSGCSNFNEDISYWNLSNVTDTSWFFSGASSFNQDINGWDMGDVTSINGMFYGATAFNQDLSEWDTSSVQDMSRVFYNASSFNQDLDSWETDSVNNMTYMFSGASSFNGDITTWRTDSVEDMSHMFLNATSFNQDIAMLGVSGSTESYWYTANVTTMQGMFQGATSFNQNIGNWNVSTVENMNNTFREAKAFNQDISDWDVDNVTNMNGMFLDASSFNQDLEDWDVDTTKVPDHKQQGMFTNTALTTTPSWYIWDGGDNFANYEGFTSNYNDYDDDEYNDTCYYINSGNHYITDFFNNM